jgi:phospholipase/carboxylesterase
VTTPTTGRHTARASSTRPASTAVGGTPGVHPLALGGQRDGLLLVPPAAETGAPLPLVLALHGAGGTARSMADLLVAPASTRGVLVLAPDSRRATWDVITGGYGPDLAFVDEALAAVFAAHPVDAGALAIAGFSDGASYALSLGLTNGDLFTDVLAWSPGFAVPASQQGRPRVFVSHGTDDRVLPIDRCSRRIVPRLRAEGYDVTYEEFTGGHVVPPDIVASSLDRLAPR